MKCPVRLHVKCTWRRYTCTWHNGQRRCTAADASIHAPSRLRTHIETCLKIVCTLKNLRRRGCARSRAPPLDPPLNAVYHIFYYSKSTRLEYFMLEWLPAHCPLGVNSMLFQYRHVQGVAFGRREIQCER